VLSLLLVLLGDLVIITFCNKLERIYLRSKIKKILREKKEKSVLFLFFLDCRQNRLERFPIARFILACCVKKFTFVNLRS
jgi:hypothetical protein